MNTEKIQRLSGGASLFLGALLVGGLIGASLMLFVAPYSGDKTRRLIKKQGRKLRNQVNDAVEDAVRPIRRRTRDIVEEARTQFEDVGGRGQEFLARQKELAVKVAQAPREALQNLTDDRLPK